MTTPHDFGPTDTALAQLLPYVERSAEACATLYAGTPYEEFVDAGLSALVYAWEVWSDTRGIAFHVFAKHVIWLRLRQTPTKYRLWKQPCGRSLPDADLLARDRGEARWYPRDSTAWFRRDLQRHWACMHRTMQQMLTDILTDCPRETIMQRDGVSLKATRKRYNALLAFLTRHVCARETSCAEESVRAHKLSRRPVALAAAD